MKVKVIIRRPHGKYSGYAVGEVIDVPGDESDLAAKYIKYGFWEKYEPAPEEPEPESEPVELPRTTWLGRKFREPTEGEDD